MASINDDEEEESKVKVMKTPWKKNAQMRMSINMCFMALEEHEDEVNSNSNYNEFQDILQELYFDIEKLVFKNISLKKKNSCLQN